MNLKYIQAKSLQQLVLDIIKVERNHRIPETERRENVVEHSFSVAMLCWKIFFELKPPLELSLILRYAMVHDFGERRQVVDTSTFAPAKDREEKKRREDAEIKHISEEFAHFTDFVFTLQKYEEQTDEEALFVRGVDRMQQLVLGEMDNWRPYKITNISYKQFCEKQEEIISKSSLYLRESYIEIYKHARETYYDRPKNTA